MSVVIVFQLRNNCYACKLHLFTDVFFNQLRYTQEGSCMISFATRDYLFIYLFISYLIYAVCCFQYSFQSLDLVVQILVLTLQMTILSRIQRRRNLAR